MKTVTLEEFKRFRPCWLETREGRKKLKAIGGRKEAWTALDVLDLPEDEVSPEDKLWAVLRPEFIPEETLHEFACRCADKEHHLMAPDVPFKIGLPAHAMVQALPFGGQVAALHGIGNTVFLVGILMGPPVQALVNGLLETLIRSEYWA